MVQQFRCKQATRKCQELHAPGKQTGRSMHVMYVYTSFDTYSDRHVLGLLLRAGVIALCCAVLCCVVLCCVVLCCARGSTTIFSYILLMYYCCCIPVQHKKRPKIKWKMKAQHCCCTYKMLVEDILEEFRKPLDYRPDCCCRFLAQIFFAEQNLSLIHI